jgi:hypothetical protein
MSGLGHSRQLIAVYNRSGHAQRAEVLVCSSDTPVSVEPGGRNWVSWSTDCSLPSILARRADERWRNLVGSAHRESHSQPGCRRRVWR